MEQTDSPPTNSFLQAYKNYARNLTDAPKIFHDLIGLNLLSLAVGRTPIEVTPDIIFPNVWILLVGYSGISRKSTCLNLARNVLPSGSYLLPNEFTKEALVEELSINPQGICLWDECGSLLKQFKINRGHYMTGLDDLLCLLYDFKGIYKRKLVKGTFQLENVCFNMVWATTISKFANVELDQISSGFLARFLIVFGEKDYAMPRRSLEPEDEERMEVAKQRLQKVWNVFHSKHLKFKFDSAALELVNAWQTEHEEELKQIPDPEEADVKGAIVTRLGDYLIKFSALYEVDDILSKNKLSNLATSHIIISIDSVLKSMKIIDKMLSLISDKLISLISSTWLSKNLAKLRRILQMAVEKTGEEWVQRQHVIRRMHLLFGGCIYLLGSSTTF